MSRADFRGLVWRGRIWMPVLLVVLPALACSYAPVEGKGCPCDTPAYKCCNEVCIPQDATCACSSVTLANPLITTGGIEVVPDAGTDVNTVLTPDGGREVQLVFGEEPAQWVSYGFKGGREIPPEAELTDDGNGFHLRASLSHAGGSGAQYVGFGLTFRAKKCVDGTAYTGVRFDLSGSMLGGGLFVGVTSAEAVSEADDPDRGTCVENDLATPVCYGSSAPIMDPTSPIRTNFADMNGGKLLHADQIVNVQWQVNDGPTVGDDFADFTVKNVGFY